MKKLSFLVLSFFVLIACEAYKIPTNVGMPSWDTHLYLKVLDRNFDVAKELCKKDTIFSSEDGKVKLNKSFAQKELEFSAPKVEQTSSSIVEIGFVALGELGSHSNSFTSANLDSGDVYILDEINLILDTGNFTKAELADVKLKLTCKDASGDTLTGIDFSEVILNAFDWEDNPKNVSFSQSGEIKISLSNSDDWLTIKSTGLSLNGSLTSDADTSLGSLSFEMLPNTQEQVQASKAVLPAGSSSIRDKTLEDTVAVSLGGDYLIYQALLDSGKISFSKKMDIEGLRISSLNVQCSELKKDGATLDETLFENPSDSTLDLQGYTLGSGAELDSLRFVYLVSYDTVSGKAIEVENTDEITVNVDFAASFVWAKAKILNASAFDLTPSDQVEEFGDDLPKFKDEDGNDKTIELAKNSVVAFSGEYPVVCESGTDSIIRYNVEVKAYKAGVVADSLDTSVVMFSASEIGKASTTSIGNLEDLINCFPDSISIKTTPEFLVSDKILTIYCDRGVQFDAKLTSDIAFNSFDTVVYYQIEDDPEEQDCPLTVAQAESAKSIEAFVKYKNRTNVTLGAEMLLCRDTTYLKDNLYSAKTSNDTIRRLDLNLLQPCAEGEYKVESLKMTSDDLRLLAGKKDEKSYSFIKIKFKGDGQSLGGDLDIQVFVEADVRVDEDVMEGQDD